MIWSVIFMVLHFADSAFSVAPWAFVSV